MSLRFFVLSLRQLQKPHRIMNQITAYIERASDGSFTISSPQVKGVYAQAPTVEEAQVEFIEMLGEQAVEIRKRTGRMPEWYGCDGLQIVFIPYNTQEEGDNDLEQQLSDIINTVSWRETYDKYLGKSAVWLYDKIGGINDSFDKQKMAKLNEALTYFSNRIKVATDGPN